MERQNKQWVEQQFTTVPSRLPINPSLTAPSARTSMARVLDKIKNGAPTAKTRRYCRAYGVVSGVEPSIFSSGVPHSSRAAQTTMPSTVPAQKQTEA